MINEAYIKSIKNLVAQNNLDEAIKQLLLLLDNSPSLDEVILQSARLSHIRREIRLGLVNHNESNITHNHIREGLLELIKEVEKQSISPKIYTEIERAVSIIGSKNLLVGSSISASGNVQIGDTTIHHHYYSAQVSHFLPSPTGRIFIFQNIADQKWVKTKLVPLLEAAGLTVHLDFKVYEKGDFEALKQTLADCKAALIVCSGKFTGNETWLLEGLVDTEYKKMLSLRLDDALVPNGITAQIEFNSGENSPEDFSPLLARLLPDEIPVWEPLDKTCIEISAMPNSGAKINLFGRAKELQLLDEAWATRNCRVLNFVAQGGTGKSALFNHWLRTMQNDHFRGAGRVLAHSFYSQGTGERVTSADQFINFALGWFGERDFEKRSPWDKGKRLAQLVSEHRTLLILDGLEPLQEGGTVDTGKVKDSALFTFIRDLAKHNEGLCIITSRLHLGGLERQAAGIRQVDLEQVSDAAGRRILQFRSDSDDKVKVMVQGDDEKLEQVVRDFGNHAFALNLLRQWLYAQSGHRIEMASTIPDLPHVPLEKGKHARRVIVAFEKLMKEKGLEEEVRMLRFLGLFDRPVSREAIRLLHPFTDFTDSLITLWQYKLVYLEKQDKILRKEIDRMVDCHPLIREHYSEVFKAEEPEIWDKCHYALYEYYEALPERLFRKFLPDTLAEMEYLFLAIRHGHLSGYRNELYSIYQERICRGRIEYLTFILGGISIDTWLLSLIYVNTDIPSALEGNVGIKMGFNYRELGELVKSIKYLKSAIDINIENDQDGLASNAAVNLSESYLLSGDIQQAVNYGELGVNLSDRLSSTQTSARVFPLTTYAYALLCQNKLDFAENLFLKADELQKESYPGFGLHSISGFQYCNLLIEKGSFYKAEQLAKFIESLGEHDKRLIDIGVGKYLRGKIHCIKSNKNYLTYADHFIHGSINYFRQCGAISFIPLGLILRTKYNRYLKNFSLCEEDLEEVLDIAESCGMRLHLTDYHLESARLRLVQKRLQDARPHILEAARLIEETGYHRRHRELLKLKASLKEP